MRIKEEGVKTGIKILHLPYVFIAGNYEMNLHLTLGNSRNSITINEEMHTTRQDIDVHL